MGEDWDIAWPLLASARAAPAVNSKVDAKAAAMRL